MNKRFIFLILFFFILGRSAAAEENCTQIEPTVEMKEIVVTATKTEEKKSDVPSAVIIKDTWDLLQSPAKTLGEFLANDLGLDWRTYGNYGGAAEEIRIRGMPGKATQVLVNGIKVNSPSLGRADLGKISLNSIERIEVVKGAGSVLYGSGAAGGTINIITKEPKRDKIEAKAEGGIGTQNTYSLSAEHGMYLMDDLGYYFTANKRETDGFRDNSDLDQIDASMKLIYEKIKGLRLLFYGDYLERDFGIPGVEPPDGTEDYFNSGVHVYSDESASLLDKGEDEEGHAALRMQISPADFVDLDLQIDYTGMENYNYQRFEDFLGRLVGQKTWTTNNVLGTEANLKIQPLNWMKVLLGADYTNYDWENEQIDLDSAGAEVPGTKSKAEEDLFSRGIFTEVQLKPLDFLKLLAGLRQELHSEFGYENVPRAGLVVQPLQQTTLKFNYGKHFQAPTLNDLYFPESPFSRGNPELEPETGWHGDFTLEQDLLDEKVKLTASYFFWEIEDRILWEPDSEGVWEPMNLKSQTGTGVEFGTEVGPYYGFKLDLNYTFIDAEEEARQYTKQQNVPADFEYYYATRRASYTPEHLFKGSVTYWSDFGLTLASSFRYVSDRVFYNTETTTYPNTITRKYKLDSYWLANLRVEQRFNNHWILAVELNNIFDQEFDTYAGTFNNYVTGNSEISFYPGSGLSLLATFSYKF